MRTCSPNHNIALASAVLGLLAFLPFAQGGVQKKSGDFFELRIETAQNAKDASVTVSVTGKAGYHCNKLYPWKLSIGAGSSAKTYGKAEAKTFGENAVVFELPYQASPGKRVTAQLKFSMCNDKQCQMLTVPLEW